MVKLYTLPLVLSSTGSIALDLNNIPKPAKNVKKCSLKMLDKNGKWPTMNLFKNRRCKGWWAVAAREQGEEGENEPNEEGLVLKVREHY